MKWKRIGQLLHVGRLMAKMLDSCSPSRYKLGTNDACSFISEPLLLWCHFSMLVMISSIKREPNYVLPGWSSVIPLVRTWSLNIALMNHTSVEMDSIFLTLSWAILTQCWATQMRADSFFVEQAECERTEGGKHLWDCWLHPYRSIEFISCLSDPSHLNHITASDLPFLRVGEGGLW